MLLSHEGHVRGSAILAPAPSAPPTSPVHAGWERGRGLQLQPVAPDVPLCNPRVPGDKLAGLVRGPLPSVRRSFRPSESLATTGAEFKSPRPRSPCSSPADPSHRGQRCSVHKHSQPRSPQDTGPQAPRVSCHVPTCVLLGFWPRGGRAGASLPGAGAPERPGGRQHLFSGSQDLQSPEVAQEGATSLLGPGGDVRVPGHLRRLHRAPWVTGARGDRRHS